MTDTPVPQTPEEPIRLPGEESPAAPSESPAPAKPSVRTVEGLEHLALQFLLAEATELAAARRYSEAEARLSAIKDGRKNPRVLDLLARIRAQQGRNAEAVELWQMAVQMDPANPDYRAGLAYVEKAGQRITHPNRLPGLLLRLTAGLLLLGLLIAVFVRLGRLEQTLAALPAPSTAAVVDVTGLETRLDDLQTSLQGVQTGLTDTRTGLNGLQTKLDDLQTASASSQKTIEGRLTALDDGQKALLASQSVEVAPLDLKLEIPGFSVAAEGDAWVITPDAGLFRYGWLLSEEARPGLEEIARQLAPLSGQARVDLIGYAADDEQDPNFNLGLIRAVLVSDVLTSAGLPAEMINITPAAGRPAPFANDTYTHRAANRTVILIIHR